MSSSSIAAKTLNRTKYSKKKTNDVTKLGGRMIRSQVATVVHDDRPMAPRALLPSTPAPQHSCCCEGRDGTPLVLATNLRKHACIYILVVLLVAVVVVGMGVGVRVGARSTSQSCQKSHGRDRRRRSLRVLYRTATLLTSPLQRALPRPE